MKTEIQIKYKDGNTETRKYSSQEKYDKINTMQVTMKLNKKTDEDILKWLNEQESKQGSIKKLIRKAINEKD
mgnify:FL=1